ncbi:MAG: hypothetical protein ACXWL2_04385 [Candidatus Chromulinivorax sp.]
MGKKASARVKSKVKNKLVRALRRVDAQELIKEQFFKDRMRRQRKDEGQLEQKGSIAR